MSNDSREYPSLRGGIQVEVESSSSESGTLGCLAATNRPNEPRRIVLLSVAHLLYAGRSGNPLGPITQSGDRACHPNACSKCSRCCSDHIGSSLRGEFSEDVDAAIATLYTGTRYLRDIEGLGAIRGTHQVTNDEATDRAHPYRVRKRGIATRVTEGTVRVLDFVTTIRSDDGGFERNARHQILIQPQTLVQVPVTAIGADGVIRADTAQFVTNNVTTHHVVEVSGPTANRGLYKILTVRNETEIVLANPRATDFPARLTAENQRPFTPIDQFIVTPDGRFGFRAPGLNANNPRLMPYDMAEIRHSTTNDGIYQVRPLGDHGEAILNDQLSVYETLTQEPAAGSEARGLIFLRIREELFTDHADSGAVLINDDQEVIGLIAGKVKQRDRHDLDGYGFATPITPVINNLGIEILTAANAGEELIVAAGAGGPEAGRALPLRNDQRAALLRAQEELLETEAGREYAELARRHQEEVRTLINTNKRVAVVWHRNKGPLLAQVALQAVQHPDVAIPADVNGQPLTLCVSNILEILERYGSVPLRLDIAALGSSWKRFSGLSYNDVKNGLDTWRPSSS